MFPDEWIPLQHEEDISGLNFPEVSEILFKSLELFCLEFDLLEPSLLVESFVDFVYSDVVDCIVCNVFWFRFGLIQFELLNLLGFVVHDSLANVFSLGNEAI